MTDDDQLAMPNDAEQRFAANLRFLRERQGISPDRVRQAIDRAFSEAPDHPEITQEGETSL